ncbi:MAG: MBL fold metallo-hydrolase [Candidatus Thorarchaeota archaeon]
MPDQEASLRAIKELFDKKVRPKEIAFTYFGWSGILLRTHKATIGFDLGKFVKREAEEMITNLDLLLYSHTHWDHYHRPGARRMVKTHNAFVVAEPQVANDLANRIPSELLITAKEGAPIRIGDFNIDAIVGVHPRPITLFRVVTDSLRLFHGADSGYVPLSKYPADVAFLPTGEPSPSCTPETALQKAIDLQPTIAVAVHGGTRETQKFQKLIENTLPQVQVIIPEPFKLVQVTL